MPTATAIWKNTPNKKDHLTNGYTSKVLFNFQYPEDGLAILNDKPNEIFDVIISEGLNYKGSSTLPTNYFIDCDDGRTLKISMSFKKLLDHNAINLGLYLEGNYLADAIGTNIGGDFTYEICEFVWYISKYYDVNESYPVLVSNGNIIYPGGINGSNLSICKIAGTNVNSYLFNPMKLQIYNNCNDRIVIKSIIIEEIS